ncbi:ABC transporter ATP-binding protein [Paenibacillus sp. F411]|uniref:ABC transporter ATP-binding protein n=1 Tax=Paenibacillus sp. F411 TaxID=2820239 RepID=UPI001AAFE4AA|nr:ABC transporter ATP-binding protein [Paenibacillus sp. F411]MBO2942830.1 ABC transporter ATP-binding protein [Paenibacillus sp. F411]
MLQISSITKKFGKKVALHNTSLTLDKGIIGLLGPNGAGKTTFLRLLSTYYVSDSGDITLNELSWSKDTEKIRKTIGYLPQQTGVFPSLKAREYLEYMGILRGMDSGQLSKEIPSVLKEVNLEEKADHLIGSFSGGMKQRLGIAQAILHQPSLLLVDEPTAGLDPEERIRFRNLIKRLGKNRLIILSTHITEDVAMTCDQALLMKAGAIEQFSSIQEIISLAKGQVWALETDLSTYETIKSNSNILITQTSILEENIIALRYIATEPIYPKAKIAVPVLEEGYMVWLNKK